MARERESSLDLDDDPAVELLMRDEAPRRGLRRVNRSSDASSDSFEYLGSKNER